MATNSVVITRGRRLSFSRLFFLFLLIAQAGHVIEHAVQLMQLYAWGHSKEHAHGVIGVLDVEWVHFGWNLVVLIAVVFVASRFRSMWIALALLIASWHQIEHVYILMVYLTTGVSGSPGLLSQGGKIAGGLPIPRPVLHAVYNLADIVPLLMGYVTASPRSAPDQLPVESSGRNSIN